MTNQDKPTQENISTANHAPSSEANSLPEKKDPNDKADDMMSADFILGLKLENAQIFDEKGQVIPVTLVKAGPCTVLQVKSEEKDGYNAVQVGFIESFKKTKKPQQGHIKKALGKETAFKFIREFRIGKLPEKIKPGKVITVASFNKGDKLRIIGTSKAKGFQGTVKRHNFKGAPKTHGTKHAHRQPGSIGATDAAKVFKGKKMAGRMGGRIVSVWSLKLVDVDLKKNLLIIKGSLPGNKKGLLKIAKIS